MGKSEACVCNSCLISKHSCVIYSEQIKIKGNIKYKNYKAFGLTIEKRPALLYVATQCKLTVS